MNGTELENAELLSFDGFHSSTAGEHYESC